VTFRKRPEKGYNPHVTFRCPEDVVEAISEHVESSEHLKNRSEFVRMAVEQELSRVDTGWEAQLPVEPDLRRAFLTVAEMANQNHMVPREAALSEVAQQESVDKRTVHRRFVRPLIKRGYLTIKSSWREGDAALRVNVHE
jgi:Arc/MetJ-type ribon-helix-helix transcriptional regulator